MFARRRPARKKHYRRDWSVAPAVFGLTSAALIAAAASDRSSSDTVSASELSRVIRGIKKELNDVLSQLTKEINNVLKKFEKDLDELEKDVDKALDKSRENGDELKNLNKKISKMDKKISNLSD